MKDENKLVDVNLGKMKNVGFEAFHWHLNDFLKSNTNMKNALIKNGVFGGSKKRFQDFLLKHETSQFILEYYLSIIQNLSIWIKPSFYSKLPHILPYSVRERSSSFNRLKKDEKDNWGSANENGFVIDDNTDIKDFIRRSTVKNSKFYANHNPYTGFIGCHIWENTTSNPRLFSFIPNLVWLPTPIAGLSDNNKCLFSSLLKKTSIELYKDKKFQSAKIEKIVINAWNLLVFKSEIDMIEYSINTKKLPFSSVSLEKIGIIVTKNIKDILYYIELIKSNEDLQMPENTKLIHKRYLPTLINIIKKSPNSLKKLEIWLGEYYNALIETNKVNIQQTLD